MSGSVTSCAAFYDYIVRAESKRTILNIALSITKDVQLKVHVVISKVKKGSRMKPTFKS